MLRRSLQNMANSLRKVQDRARRSSIATTETETERSIKALFSERIVKGRPDLFVPSTPIPTDMDESEVSSPLGVLQINVSGFVYLLYVPHVQFSQFLKQSSSASTDGDDQDAKQRDFNKRMGRSDAESSLISLFLVLNETPRICFCKQTKTHVNLQFHRFEFVYPYSKDVTTQSSTRPPKLQR